MTDNPDDVKQLDRYNVPTAVLKAAGAPLVDLIGEQGAASVDDMLGPPPIDGWRVIDGDLASSDPQVPILAAPWVNRDPNCGC
jgi:hypothetical protein